MNYWRNSGVIAELWKKSWRNAQSNSEEIKEGIPGKNSERILRVTLKKLLKEPRRKFKEIPDGALDKKLWMKSSGIAGEISARIPGGNLEEVPRNCWKSFWRKLLDVPLEEISRAIPGVKPEKNSGRNPLEEILGSIPGRYPRSSNSIENHLRNPWRKFPEEFLGDIHEGILETPEEFLEEISREISKRNLRINSLNKSVMSLWRKSPGEFLNEISWVNPCKNFWTKSLCEFLEEIPGRNLEKNLRSCPYKLHASSLNWNKHQNSSDLLRNLLEIISFGKYFSSCSFKMQNISGKYWKGGGETVIIGIVCKNFEICIDRALC